MNYKLALIGLIAVLLSGCRSSRQLQIAPEIKEQQRTAMIDTIARLPKYSIYEETPEDFARRLSAGEYWVDCAHTRYLFISGDGTVRRRLFCMNAAQELSVFCLDEDEDEGPETVSLYRYDGKELHFVATYPREHMDRLIPPGDISHNDQPLPQP